MGRGVMIFRWGIDITRGIGWPVLGPGIARAYLGPLNATRRQPSGIFAPKYATVTVTLTVKNQYFLFTIH